MSSDTSFPRQYARTQRFRLGVPGSFEIAPDGERIAFVRSRTGTDRTTCLWLRGVLCEEWPAALPSGTHAIRLAGPPSANLVARPL